jgi:hypothetical protein
MTPTTCRPGRSGGLFIHSSTSGGSSIRRSSTIWRTRAPFSPTSTGGQPIRVADLRHDLPGGRAVVAAPTGLGQPHHAPARAPDSALIAAAERCAPATFGACR